MSTRHVTEAELARDVRAILDDVSRGAEIAIDRDSRTVAVLRPVSAPKRSIEECIAIASSFDSKATLDPEFAAVVQEVIDSRQPLDTSLWD